MRLQERKAGLILRMMTLATLCLQHLQCTFHLSAAFNHAAWFTGSFCFPPLWSQYSCPREAASNISLIWRSQRILLSVHAWRSSQFVRYPNTYGEYRDDPYFRLHQVLSSAEAFLCDPLFLCACLRCCCPDRSNLLQAPSSCSPWRTFPADRFYER